MIAVLQLLRAQGAGVGDAAPQPGAHGIGAVEGLLQRPEQVVRVDAVAHEHAGWPGRGIVHHADGVMERGAVQQTAAVRDHEADVIGKAGIRKGPRNAHRLRRAGQDAGIEEIRPDGLPFLQMPPVVLIGLLCGERIAGRILVFGRVDAAHQGLHVIVCGQAADKAHVFCQKIAAPPDRGPDPLPVSAPAGDAAHQRDMILFGNGEILPVDRFQAFAVPGVQHPSGRIERRVQFASEFILHALIGGTDVVHHRGGAEHVIIDHRGHAPVL